jgi:steroid Delta-isomerase
VVIVGPGGRWNIDGESFAGHGTQLRPGRTSDAHGERAATAPPSVRTKGGASPQSGRRETALGTALRAIHQSTIVYKGVSMGPTVEQRRAAVERYLALVGTGTSEQIMELFGPDPVIEDPVGDEPKRGREAVHAFFASFENIKGISAHLREFHASGDYWAAFAFDALTPSEALDANFDQEGVPRGSKLRASVIEVMTFDDDGLVVGTKAYWTPALDVVSES